MKCSPGDFFDLSCENVTYIIILFHQLFCNYLFCYAMLRNKLWPNLQEPHVLAHCLHFLYLDSQRDGKKKVSALEAKNNATK